MFSRISRLPVLAVMALVLLVGGAFAGAAIAQSDEDVFYACEQNGKVIPGTISVNVEPNCAGSRTLVSWNSEAPQGPQFDSCVGTYLIDFGGGEALWTFSADGTVQATDAGEDGRPGLFDPFSHQQGAWTATADFVAKATTLNFRFAGDFGPGGDVARTDMTYTPTSDCTAMAFDFDLRFYAPGQDPLNPNDGTTGFGGTGTGRLLTTP